VASAETEREEGADVQMKEGTKSDFDVLESLLLKASNELAILNATNEFSHLSKLREKSA